MCCFLLLIPLPGSWWGIRVTSVTPAGLRARWARSRPLASPKPTTWCFSRRPPRTLQTNAWAVDEEMGRCRISRIRWRTLLLLSAPNWGDRRDLQQQTPWCTTAPSKSRTRRDQTRRCGSAAERMMELFQVEECEFLVCVCVRVCVCERGRE